MQEIIKEKRTFYTELAYVVGIVALAFGTALSERADFGMSMVVAPAYLVHLKVSEVFSWFSFGIAEYCTQAVLLVATAIVLKRFKGMYLLSFVTTIIYGLLLDLFISSIALFGEPAMVGRVLLFVFGMLFCSLGVSMLFHTYFPPEAYELLVKEISTKFNTNINKTKTIYDCTSCVVAIVMSFVFFGLWHFEGIKWGTVICAILNGFLIGRFSKLFESIFEYKDGLKIRNKLENNV